MTILNKLCIPRILLLLFCLGMAGCGGNNLIRENVEEIAVLGESADKTIPYRLAPGDAVSVHYYKSYSSLGEDYKIDVGDKISISVDRHPEYSREVVVLPGGAISAPLAGKLKVAGLTTTQLDELLTESYKTHFNSPVVDVFVIEPQNKVNDFINLVFKNNGDRSLTYSLREDGSIDLPLIGEVPISGLSIPEARKRIKESYKRTFKEADLDVSVNLLTSSQTRIAVLGEVFRPGIYQISGRVNPLYAIAMAGGHMDTANMDKIVIVRGKEGHPTKKINFSSTAAAFNPAYGIQSGDIVYVPKTGIANADLVVDQYIRKLLPLNLGTGLYYNLK